MDAKVAKPKVVPFSLKDAPSLIERVWPAQKISVETQKERKAGASQTLTSLGSYWKGRKPLVLIRACIMGALLPSTGDHAKDIEIFELLLGMSDCQIESRLKESLSIDEVTAFGTEAHKDALLEERDGVVRFKTIPRDLRDPLFASVLARMPYSKRIEFLYRPEEIDEDDLLGSHIQKLKEHLGIDAQNVSDFVKELGRLRFGHVSVVGDAFAGGGSIPYEAARLGCDTYASDLNPIACLLTWSAMNVVGASGKVHARIVSACEEVMRGLREEVDSLGFELDSKGNLTKAQYYCLETRCPQTGWTVPMCPSWVISTVKNVIAVLVPDHDHKRFRIELKYDASADEFEKAALGTVRKGNLVYTLDGETYTTPIKTLRGDARVGRTTTNKIRPWDRSEISPRTGDIFDERLYCIQWIVKDTINSARPTTYFAAPTEYDLANETKVEKYVLKNLETWRDQGLVPDMAIEPGAKTDEPIRTRGWTYWHHLFAPRQIMLLALLGKHVRDQRIVDPEFLYAAYTNVINRQSKMCRIDVFNGVGRDPKLSDTFTNQALNTLYNYGCRSSHYLIDLFVVPKQSTINAESNAINCGSAESIKAQCDVWITDPPYADAVYYHEITEFFIAWLRKQGAQRFPNWIWDSRRPLAIKGDGEEFRHGMVNAYEAMTMQMSGNGIQIVMFTHQSAAVWADMAQIFWGAGLQVMAAWYIATETTSELKKGGYVQGTVIMVLRKRKLNEAGYKDEIVQEVKSEVADQIETMVGLNQSLKGSGRTENLFEDADLQMAGYAAALRVLTKYEKIDGTDMTKEALRPRRVGEKNLVGEIIDFAVQVANEHMVPEHMSAKLWEGLSGAERFYFKMMDIETTSLRKLDNYQNFAKAFRVGDYGALMGSVEPNKARLKTAKEFKKSGFEIPEFGPSATRAVLFGIFELENEVEGDDVLSHLKDMLPNYHNKRDDLAAIADYIARKREAVDETESRAARILHGLIRNERLG